MALPHYVIIGEQKAGTGWLRDRLFEHPGVFMYPHEVNFFNRKSLFARGPEWYASLFPTDGRVCGEKSPEYFWFNSGRSDYEQNFAPAMRSMLPRGRIVLVVREPIARAQSALNHHLYHRGGRVDPYVAKREGFGGLLFGPRAESLQQFGVIERGFYAERLRQAMQVFGSDLRVLVFEEDIVKNPARGLEMVCEHIGVDPSLGAFDLAHNRKERKPSFGRIAVGYHIPVLRPVLRIFDRGAPFTVGIDAESRTKLQRLYADDIAQTEQLLNRSLDSWRASQ